MLYEEKRPKTIEDFCGKEQKKAAKDILDPEYKPFNLLLTGPSGSGKTSLGKLYATKVAPDNVKEVNCRNIGVGDLRTLLEKNYGPKLIGNRYTALFLQELHALSKEAQQSLLFIENTTDRYLYIIADTDQPNELTPALRSRFVKKSLTVPDMEEIRKFVFRVLTEEGFDFENITDQQKEAINLCILDASGNLREMVDNLEEFLSTGDFLGTTEDEELKKSNIFGLVVKKAPIKEIAEAAKEEKNLFGLTIGLTTWAYDNIVKGKRVSEMKKILSVFGKGLDSRYAAHVAFVLLYDEYISGR